MFADQIRLAVETAPRAKLPEVTALLWRAYTDGNVSEAEAEALSGLIEARQVLRSPISGSSNPTAPGLRSPDEASANRSGCPRKAVGSRPRTDASMERRRRWAASGRLPPAIAARFTLAEQSVLALVAAETTRRGDCRLAVGHLAAIVGVAETTVRNAIREARKHGLVTVEERRITGFRNDTNVVRIISPEWSAWLRLARKGGVLKFEDTRHPPLPQGGGCKSAKGTPTAIPYPVNSGTRKPKKGCRQAAGDPTQSDDAGIRARDRAGRAMP